MWRITNVLKCRLLGCLHFFGGMTLNTAAEPCGSQLSRALNSSPAMSPLQEFPHPFCFAPLADSRCTIPFLHNFSLRSSFHLLELVLCSWGPGSGFERRNSRSSILSAEFVFAAPFLAKWTFVLPRPSLSSLPLQVAANSVSRAYLRAVCVRCRWGKICQEK